MTELDALSMTFSRVLMSVGGKGYFWDHMEKAWQLANLLYMPCLDFEFNCAADLLDREMR